MNKEMSEILTRTNRGTAMGNLMRRYWVPALLASEIAEPDGPQVRVQLLGEKLLAFRDTDGKARLISEFCSHRGVSLYFGRNEENGIRCAYHGVKFDGDGKCVDVPSSQQACARMHITAYPCVERGGIVWTYMGPEDKKPAPPELEWCTLPESHVFVSKRLQFSNYLQAMEGGIDTSHVSFVHSQEVDSDPMHQGVKALDYIKADGNVVFDIEKTTFGLTLFGRRNGEPDSFYWRVTQWLFPWFTLIPPFGEHSLAGHVWVPIDDHNCWAWSINFRPDRPLSTEERQQMEEGKGIHVEYEAPGSYVPKANMQNDYLMDRVAQKENRAYSGIFGFAAQDFSLQESMGPIQDHEAENLLPTDKAIVMARRMLQEAALGLADGAEPPALDSAEQRVRAAGVLLPHDADPIEWAKSKLADGLNQKVYSI
ncbi:MAG TPA: (2Fe-2S)-binding protein [Hydrogenophaga sp.]|jgi:phenylpropionate dioxygenase-like ring-hydroxylating dioxygenase large terminal subunit|uniref:aromatic ring-hydroxylating dioxygenase subunit alpha n=1 Tax=Hydrogenophaga TaxID=47420 RepID=UPI0008D59DC6|nr:MULTISPECIES: aromatic ring-hydroxylating dioxygenase subunit alpha [Hydrogenophaga]OGA75360.1 MAG: (2Fe-2S)-binding protein [Burkholderiales bacterium GWE1_65_30]OGA93490.1 MAG: (2Fe-2S)-binding protein [Burkholderiales bacterium GWF1_66_17]UCU94977.1 aromatic ring-hydroxylating dioxygenase subunit alpha [Hydrogenophaga taeniospiralis]HAX19445.1 (2Fe-2S)-binding protein [Hydrogenophaga sp.]HBU17762.1 (2Fe-2S)-binding protein [Hydrogenophaga sp.]